MGWTHDTLEENTVKNMIKIVASEFVVDPKKAKGKSMPKGSKKKNRAPETEEISDGSFEDLAPPEKDVKSQAKAKASMPSPSTT